MKSLGFLVTWYFSTVLTLLFAIIFLLQLSFPKNIPIQSGQQYERYKALPAQTEINYQSIEVNSKDGRALIIKEMFELHKAPLASHADKFVEVADRYGLDYRLLPAISMQESNGGKKIPDGSYNPFGYGIYGDKILKFVSFDESIEKVAKGLKENYINFGFKTVDEIMFKYNPPSRENGGLWGDGVNTFLEHLR